MSTDSTTSQPHEPLGGVVGYGPSFGIGNEFAGAVLRKAHTHQGERVEIRIPATGAVVLLDAMQLEILAGVGAEWFTAQLTRQLEGDVVADSLPVKSSSPHR